MRRFRKTGSITRFFVEGPPADPADLDLVKALQKGRFRPLGESATEDLSIGWVSREDPSGARFEPGAIVKPPFLVFALRIDRKRVSPALLRMEIAARLRAEGAGGARLPRERRRAIVLEAKRQLVARALPAVSLVDCLWNVGAHVLYVFASGGLTLEIAAREFRGTFDRPLTLATPSVVARRLGLAPAVLRSLDAVSPADFAPRARTKALDVAAELLDT